MSPEPVTERQQRRIRIWWSMTPEQRDYDRHVARQIPFGLPPEERFRVECPGTLAAIRERDEASDDAEPECSCHINPPCSLCTSQPEEPTAGAEPPGPA